MGEEVRRNRVTVAATAVSGRSQPNGKVRDARHAPDQEWAIAVGDFDSGRYVVLSRFRNHLGARSWRPSHPHPVFSPDGHRIYFNVSSDRWTRLYVAERSVN